MKKRILSMLLSICMVCSLLPVTAGASRSVIHIAASEATYHADGSLKSIKTTFDWDSQGAKGRLVLMTKRLRSAREEGTDWIYGDFTDGGYYAKNFNWTEFDQVLAYDTDSNNKPFGILSYTDEALLPRYSENNEKTISFQEGAVPIGVETTYYVYLWTKYGGIFNDNSEEYYPDALILVIQTKDNTVKYTPATGQNTYEPNNFSEASTGALEKYSVTVTPGHDMTKTEDSGDAIQSGLHVAKGMKPVVYTANSGFYFPEEYAVAGVTGITVTRDGAAQITVSGTPTNNTNITLTNATTSVVYNVTLNANVGTIHSGAVASYTEHVGATLPTNVRKDGYDFGGWFDNITCTGEAVTVIPEDATGDKEYWAKWTPTPAVTPSVWTTSRELELVQGYTEGSIGVTANALRHELSYQWYSCADTSKTNPMAADGATTESTYTIPTGKDVGTYYYYCTVTATRGDNGESASRDSDVIKVTISAKPAQTLSFAEDSVTKTYGDDAFVMEAVHTTGNGAVTYASSDSDIATVNSSTGEVTILKAGTVTITATAAETSEYAEASVSYTLTVNKKSIAEPTVSGNYVYNCGQDVTAVLVGFDENTMTQSGTATAANAGEYTITFGLREPEKYQWADGADGNVTWTIAKATPTGTPSYTAITSDGKTLADTVLNAGTITPAGGTITWDLGNAQSVAANTAYLWTYTPVDTANYNNLTGSLTPYVASASSSHNDSSSQYKVEDITPDKADGRVSFDRTTARKGSKVTVTVTPDPYYKVDGVIVRDKKGNEVPVTENEDGSYTFRMPAGKVTVEPVFSWDNPFTDVEEDTYYTPAVEWGLKNGITNGTGDGTTFNPEFSCTRAEMVAFLWRVAGSPDPVDSGNPFTDVSEEAYYAQAVQWAYEQGITGGTGDFTFSPDAPCTRGQMVTLLCRMEKGEPMEGADVFDDIEADAYYVEAVRWAVENGVTNGTGGNHFSPEAICTRAQMLTFLYRQFME